MKVIKVINNNNLCVLDDGGREQIVSGCGIGFGKKYGDAVNPSKVQKTYLITDSELQKRMITMLKEIPNEYIVFTNDMVEHIKRVYPHRLGESLLVALSDHVAFAIERAKRGVSLTNSLLDSIRGAYPDEIRLGEYCVEQMRIRLGVRMAADEAGFIAMHILNARLDSRRDEAYDVTEIVDGCVAAAERFAGEPFDRSSIYFERFTTHLKFLAQRLLRDQPLSRRLSEDTIFLAMIKKTCNRHFQCAQAIQEHILREHGKSVNDDELISLAIHLKRISGDAGS